jgi:hypothetical protein
MSATLTQPSAAEVSAAEKVLAEAHGCNPDGYWRPLAEAALEAAKDAGLGEITALIDLEIENTERALAAFRGSPMDRVGAAWDTALGEGRN